MVNKTCRFCYTRPVPPRKRTCGASECMSKHLAEAKLKKELSDKHGQLWTTAELQADYDVQGFALGFVVVIRKSDGKRGSLDFTHSPRFYYSFQEG